MAEALKILGQAALAATTNTDVYTVPASTSAVISTLVICNRSATATMLVRVQVAIAGAVSTNAQYLYYDTPVPIYDSLTLTLGISLATTDVVRVYCSTANCSVNAFGAEVT